MQVGFYHSASALNSLEHWQQSVSHNLASSQVAGYKAQVFALSGAASGQLSHTNQAGVQVHGPQAPVAEMRLDPRGGALQATDAPLDLAIDGPGYFAIEAEDGNTHYTRNGQFHLDPDNRVVTHRGEALLAQGNPITLNPSGGPLSVSPSGALSQDGVPLGQLELTQFNNPAGLESIGGAFRAGSVIDPQEEAVETPHIRQGFVEAANTQPIQEMVQLIQLSRAHEANHRVMTAFDERIESTLRSLDPTA